MANMTSDIQRMSKGEEDLWSFGVKGGGAATIYKGGVLIEDVSDSNYAQKMTSSITAASGDVFLGIAAEGVTTVAADADAAKTVRAWQDGVWAFAVGALGKGDIGKAIYATDDQTITLTSTNALWIGYLVDVDATWAWVDIEPATHHVNSVT